MVFQTFTSFPHLPLELRNQIWTLSIQPRIVNIESTHASQIKRLPSYVPVILRTCQESRALGLTHYIILRPNFTTFPPPMEENEIGIYFSPIHDTLYLPPAKFRSTNDPEPFKHINSAFFPSIRNLAIGYSLGVFVATNNTEPLSSLLYPKDDSQLSRLTRTDMHSNMLVNRPWYRQFLQFPNLDQLLFIETIIQDGENRELFFVDRKDEPLVAVDCDVADALQESGTEGYQLANIYEDEIEEVQKVTKRDGRDFFERMVERCEKFLEFAKSVLAKGNNCESRPSLKWLLLYHVKRRISGASKLITILGPMPKVRVVQLMDQESVDRLLENRRSYWEKEDLWREWIKGVPAQIEALNLEKSKE